MQYAILCYDDEKIVEGWTQAEDDAVISKHRAYTAELAKEGRVGPVLRLLPTRAAMTVRGRDQPLVVDGPFAETKEQLLGLWIVDADTQDDALAIAKELHSHKGHGSLEVRPLLAYMPHEIAERQPEAKKQVA